jgi:hypothetical protein
MKITRWGLGLLSVAGLLLSARDADAFLFCHCCGHHCCETHICCRPYNAFTPICWGNIHCDGCCMQPCTMCSNYMAMMPGNACAPGPMGGMPFGCGPGCGMNGAPMPSMPAAGLAPGAMPGVAPMPVSAPPAPGTPPANPNVPPIYNQTAQYGDPAASYGYGVQPISYYPGYYGYPMPYYPPVYPGAYPYNMYPYGYGYYGGPRMN